MPIYIAYIYVCVLGIIMINILWVTYQVQVGTITIPTRLKEEKEKDSHRVSGTQLFNL